VVCLAIELGDDVEVPRRGGSLANYEEARGAESSDDFVHKMSIAFKEMREARYWISLAAEATMISARKADALIDEATQLRAILTKSVAAARKNTQSTPI
jgi:four helix bundle protein